MRVKLSALVVWNVIITGLVLCLLWLNLTYSRAEDVLTEFQIYRIVNSAYTYYCDTGHWPNKKTYVSDLSMDTSVSTNTTNRLQREGVLDGYGYLFEYTITATEFRVFSQGNDHEINTADDVFGLCDINGNKGVHRPGRTMATPHFKFDPSVQRWYPVAEDDDLLMRRSRQMYCPENSRFPLNYYNFNY